MRVVEISQIVGKFEEETAHTSDNVTIDIGLSQLTPKTKSVHFSKEVVDAIRRRRCEDARYAAKHFALSRVSNPGTSADVPFDIVGKTGNILPGQSTETETAPAAGSPSSLSLSSPWLRRRQLQSTNFEELIEEISPHDK